MLLLYYYYYILLIRAYHHSEQYSLVTKRRWLRFDVSITGNTSHAVFLWIAKCHLTNMILRHWRFIIKFITLLLHKLVHWRIEGARPARAPQVPYSSRFNIQTFQNEGAPGVAPPHEVNAPCGKSWISHSKILLDLPNRKQYHNLSFTCEGFGKVM